MIFPGFSFCGWRLPLLGGGMFGSNFDVAPYPWGKGGRLFIPSYQVTILIKPFFKCSNALIQPFILTIKLHLISSYTFIIRMTIYSKSDVSIAFRMDRLVLMPFFMAWWSHILCMIWPLQNHIGYHPLFNIFYDNHGCLPLLHSFIIFPSPYGWTVDCISTWFWSLKSPYKRSDQFYWNPFL
jgi:hypothetical protein